MAELSVLGLGNWGTALANCLAENGHDVLGWSIDDGVSESINSTHRNPLFLNDVALHPGLRATGNLSDALSAPIIVLAVPSAALSDVVPQLDLPDGAGLVSAIKGIELESLQTPLQYLRSRLATAVSLCVFSGPTFAKDVVIGKPAGVVAASENEDFARRVAECFVSDSLKVYTSGDTLGVELGGITKNVIAVAAGICDGLELGDSARVGLITRGLAEMTRLAVAMGAEARTLSGLSGLGDLVMTATCDASRNRTVGLRLGRGEALDHIIETLGSVAEGVKTAPLILQLAKRHGVEMPISEQVNEIISGRATPKDAMQALISRPLKPEFR